MEIRVATKHDVPELSNLLSLAFSSDPTWGPALESTSVSSEFLSAYWKTYVDGAMPWNQVFTNDDLTAVAVWLPWGAPELSAEQEADLRQLVLTHLTAEAANELFMLWDLLDRHHPHDEPHSYLSLLATHPDHAGHGYGQKLLAACLEQSDAAGVPTFLESSNMANNRRYERAGYRPIGGFNAVRSDAWLTTMWRDPR
jgi:GNAT superfamily N-acetyltransferase